VADSALYSKKFLLNKEITGDWISRVPESIKKAKRLVEVSHKKQEWIEINSDLKYREVMVKYGRVRQKWIVVNSRSARFKEIATLKKNLNKEAVLIAKKVKKLSKRMFYTKEAMNLEFRRIQNHHPYFTIRNMALGHYAKKRRGERRPRRIGFKCCIGFEQNKSKITRLENKKGKFIVATSLLCDTYSAEKIIDIYTGRTKQIEGCFKFLKDSTFKLNEVYLKRIDRIEALMSVMALSLFVNNLGQLLLRSSLKEKNRFVPSQVGKNTQQPTLKWAFQLMRKVVKVKASFLGKEFEQFSGLDVAQKLIIDCFGFTAQKIYGFP